MALPEPDDYSVPRHDVIALISGLLVFVASFLPWYAVNFEGPAESGVIGRANAWHGLAGVGLILLLFSLVVAAAEPFFFGEDAPRLPMRITASALACVGAVCVIVNSFHLPDPGVPDADVALQWGGWILIVLVLAQAGISVLRVVHAKDRVVQ